MRHGSSGEGYRRQRTSGDNRGRPGMVEDSWGLLTIGGDGGLWGIVEDSGGWWGTAGDGMSDVTLREKNHFGGPSTKTIVPYVYQVLGVVRPGTPKMTDHGPWSIPSSHEDRQIGQLGTLSSSAIPGIGIFWHTVTVSVKS